MEILERIWFFQKETKIKKREINICDDVDFMYSVDI